MKTLKTHMNENGVLIEEEGNGTEDGAVEENLHLLMVDPHIPAGAKLY